MEMKSRAIRGEGDTSLVVYVAVSCWQQSGMGTGLRAAAAGLAILVCVMAEGQRHPGPCSFLCRMVPLGKTSTL